MPEIDRPLPAETILEANLYLLGTPCSACSGRRRIDPAAMPVPGHAHRLSARVHCPSCQKDATIVFEINSGEIAGHPIRWFEKVEAFGGSGAPSISASESPSKLIDLSGWLTLVSLFQEQARAHPNEKAKARPFELMASACLEEALKFYDADNDLPPEDAFFFTASRKRFVDRPELFTRQRLINERNALPRVPAAQPSAPTVKPEASTPPESSGKPSWWPFGKKR